MKGRASMSGSQSSLREANRALLVRTVQRYGGITQVELAGLTGLSAATVSTIVKELLSSGVVDTRTTTRSGRRAQLVTLSRRTGLAAGVQVGPRSLRVALADLNHEVLAERTMPLPLDHRADTSLDRVALLIVELVENLGAALEEVVAIGVSLPAPVEPGMGVISVQGLVPGWDEISVPEVLTGRLGVPVVVDNDANLGALAESRFGASRGDRDLIFVRASYGVGAGIILGGELHRGFAGTAGEIGHVQVDPQGQICRCGSRGCLNTVVGAQSLTESLRTSRGVVTLRDIVQLARDRDPGCRRLVADAGAAIGAVVAAMAVAINPQSIVVGGELAETGEVLLDPIREAVNHGALPNRIAPIEVMASELGPRAELRGAIALALEHGERPSLAVASERGLRLLDGAGQTLAVPGYPLEREAGES